MRMTQQQYGTLFVEIRLDASAKQGFRDKEIMSEIGVWIRKNHAEVKIGTEVHLGPAFATTIESVEITGHSKSKTFPDNNLYSVVESGMEIVAYTLASNDESQSWNSQVEDEGGNITSRQFDVTKLPNQAFDRLWESLIYGDPVGELTLRTLIRAVRLRWDNPIAWQRSSWQNTVLFHGSPGSGKTALAQALAQRLSIRLSNMFPTTKLLQINAHTAFSHYFGETTKKIGRLFDSITDLASDGTPLMIVIFDEVETVAGSREQALQKNEPVDAIRATNEILRGLDKCRKHSNIIFFFTSNFISSLDPAFVDRCCIEEEISTPTTECAFEILRMEMNDLIDHGFIVFKTLIYEEFVDLSNKPLDTSFAFVQTPKDISPEDSSQFRELSRIPSREWANSYWPSKARTVVSELYRIAILASGLSGRKLKGLVIQAYYKYIVDEPGELHDMLNALEAVIRRQTGQHGRSVENEAVCKSDLEAGKDQVEDVAEFLMSLEADENMNNAKS
ncbi:P-loop containing nucleoside triphosphate hydrolase protein [Pyrenochaeta sp. MPI-SDFR-AT-0127]|nr:P-loop containing nucleoside triphosphate hydrolase protein [Pyrenochaeta sp. MPI-SDFR-AT-0127]